MSDGPPISVLIVLDTLDVSEPDQLEDFVEVYYALRKADARLLIASENGGYPWPRRPKTSQGGGSGLVNRFLADRYARDEVADTLRLRDVFVEDFAACVLIGRACSLWETDCSSARLLVGDFLKAGKPVAAISSKISFMPRGAASGLALISNGGSGLPAAINALLSVLEEGAAPKGSDDC
jgi:hypothetical protein